MCSKCCGNCIYAWGEQWHNSGEGVNFGSCAQKERELKKAGKMK